MGKKSKKKGGAANKAARKEKMQERREQQLDQYSDDGDAMRRSKILFEREYFEGDRVWYQDDRGIVHAVDGEFLEIKPLQSLIDGINNTHRVSKMHVNPDFCDMTLRFDVGDKVICNSTEAGWTPAEVTQLWPTGEIYTDAYPFPVSCVDVVPHYRCSMVFNNSFRSPTICAPADDDECIQIRPTSFRFKVGDDVTFNSMKARGNNAAAEKQLEKGALWTSGKIVLVDICEEGTDYAAYECSFQVATKKYSCLINDDDDEHIALVDQDPRKRLFDAIEQDCSREHFIHLTSHFNIDVAAFSDLVMTKAIEFASYNALTWLQQDCNIDVRLIKDKETGNNFLHMIANSPFASRFIRKVGGKSCAPGYSDDAKLDIIEYYGNMTTKELNNNGEVWLQSLVRRGDVKALDVAFSPHSGLAWDNYFFDADVLKKVAASIKESDNPTMQIIFDTFVSFRTIYRQLDALFMSFHDSEEALLQDEKLAVFRGEEATRSAKLMTRFYRDWKDHPSKELDIGRGFSDLVRKGMFRLFQLLYEADQSIFEIDYLAQSNEDRQQFIQEELRTSAKKDYSLTTNIFNACILGSHCFDLYDDDFQHYRQHVIRHFLFCDAGNCPSLHHHLSREKESSSHSRTSDDCVTYRLKLIEDDNDYEGRQKILEYLLLKHTDVRLDVLIPLKHRQCWVLRFMVEKKYLDLEGLAAEEMTLTQNASALSFLNSGTIPSNITVRCCLCFAAVQYDDLQSLEWLCETRGIPDDLVGGWNLLHYSAYMGRIEIIGWLSNQLVVWNSLVSQASTRKPFGGIFAVHIAASCGHLHACDVLIRLNVPLEDKKGKLPDDYAKKSRYEFVRKWAADRAKPQALLKDVKRLLRLVEERESLSQIKDFILSSKCLHINTWRACDCFDFNERLMGISFRDVIHGCCKNADIELAKWICFRLCFNRRYVDFWDLDDWAQNKNTKLLSRDDLVSFASERGYDDLVGQLQMNWFKEVSCEDPLTRNPVLEAALGGDERLVDVRAAILRINVLEKIAEVSKRAIFVILERGGRVDELEELLTIKAAAREAVMFEAGSMFFDEESGFNYSLMPFAMTTDLSRYGQKHTTSELLLWEESGYHWRDRVHIVLATEGYTELLRFCLSNLQGWTATMELNTVRIASFFGHTEIVEMLLSPDGTFALLSDEKDRHNAVILGAGGALRYRDLEALVKMYGAPTDSIKRFEGGSVESYGEIMSESLLVAVLNGYAKELFDFDVDNKTTLKTLRFLVENCMYTNDEILYAMELMLDKERYFIAWMECVLDLLQSVIDVLGLQPICHPDQMQEICKKVVGTADTGGGAAAIGILAFLEKMATAGIDIQQLNEESRRFLQNDFRRDLANLQQKQLRDWSRFDIVKKGGSLADIQQVVKDGGLTVDSRERGGRLLTHLSAAYNRVDLLEWLVVSEGMDLDSLDAQHRTTLDVAKASKASLATKWIIEWRAKTTIGSFLRRNYYHAMHRRRLQRSNEAATLIQSIIRAYATRKLFANVLKRRMEESQRFVSVWGRLIASLDNCAVTLTSWAGIREQLIDIKVGLGDEMLDDTDQRLSRAMEGAVQEESNEDYDIIDSSVYSEELATDDGIANEARHNLNNMNITNQWLSFQMTSHVVKFLQQGDKKYRSFFVRRMRQLATGERSRILQKPLKGSKSLIYETYLEQKSGHRILWTEESGNIVVWYVAKHKQVSRLMQLIDDSKSRSARQQVPQTLVSELQNESLLPQNEPKNEILLDIFNNVPLKIYDVSFTSINEIAKESWTPKLHLTDEERDVVEAEGTVLVLGRSGCGKTICIANRIEFDRQSNDGQDPSFTQLFVARSVRLCRYVEGAVGEDNRSSFSTYEKLLNDIESSLPGQSRNFNPSQKMDFGRFKRDFHSQPSSNEKVSALISWTVIRTFLKGSIEAFQSLDGILPRDAFVEVERLGNKRCRVPQELREQVYDEFLRYQKYLEDHQLWDDCDRVRHLLFRIKESMEVDPDAFGQVQRSKVYVDEVQDYTQLEILLFFYLGGPNGLFLAGDPAQSVVEGTEFRFEEIRSVAHFVGSTIQKPKTVNVNFRSHSGILNCAGGVLDFMFSYFPSSVKQLKKDAGLFQGSRPGVLSGASIHQLNILLSDKLKGAVVLTHDETSRHWRRQLNDYKLVYGIREAKGLEFKTVIILDFFREIPSSLQKPWRELVLGRVSEGFERSHPLVGTLLKLLYTGVTRCIEKLFFVETKSSTAGDATIRWLTKKGLDRPTFATRNNINDVEAMSLTSDEFVSDGISNAELAQAVEELDQAQLLLERSLWCFEQTDNIELAAKARIHSSSIQFRLDLQPPYDEMKANDRAVIEIKSAQLMESLTKEGFLFEVVNIFSSVSPFLSEYAREELEKRFVRKVRLLVGE